MIRIDRLPLNHPPVAIQSEANSCCERTMKIALPILASLAGFVLLPFEIAAALSIAVTIGALSYSGCLAKETLGSIFMTSPVGFRGTPLPRPEQKDPSYYVPTPHIPMPRPVNPTPHLPPPNRAFNFRPLSDIKETEEVNPRHNHHSVPLRFAPPQQHFAAPMPVLPRPREREQVNQAQRADQIARHVMPPVPHPQLAQNQRPAPRPQFPANERERVG